MRPDGTIRLSAPHRADEERLRAFVRQHREWLLRQADKQRERQAPVEHLRNGGRMLLWGGWVEVVRTEGNRAVAELRDGQVHIVAADDEAAHRAADRLRRRELEAKVEEIAPALEQRVGRSPVQYRFRTMTSRWGTCNIRTKQITLNTWLVQRDPQELEYVLVHELAHLIEGGHGPRFRAVMDRALPGWDEVRRRLQQTMPPRR